MNLFPTRLLALTSVIALCLLFLPVEKATAAAPAVDEGKQQATPGAETTQQHQEDDTEPRISVEECVKCHYQIVRLISRRGRAHRDKVNCIDCHHGHPPTDSDVIPKCSKCHNSHRHFSLPDCLTCHNPHRPLDIELPNRITEPCMTCHEFQSEQLLKFPSIHTRLGCTACHKQHGKIPSCYRCHESHIEGVTDDEGPCKKCHQAHMPLVVTYGAETEVEVCAGCHSKIVTLLRSSKAKHNSFLCSKCHPPPHKTIPVCRDCHGAPHSEYILEKFKNCGECHGKAHDIAI